MGYQSEAQLEEQLLKKLQTLGYDFVKIKDYEELVANFRKELNAFNKKVLEDREMSDTEFNRIMTQVTGKTVYQCAGQLRDKVVLDRDDGSRISVEFMSKYPENNHYQVTNQVTVVGKYKNRYDVTLLCNGLPIVQIEKSLRIADIGFEDYYLIHDLLCQKENIFNPERFVIRETLKMAYFHSIYNQGKLNLLFQRFDKGLITFLKTYDNIFTTNYDSNLESATGKDVYHIHG